MGKIRYIAGEPPYRIEHGRKVYTMETTIGCEKRPPKPMNNEDVIPSKEGIQKMDPQSS